MSLFSSWPCYTIEEAESVQKVLLSNKVNYWTGTESVYFENEFADFIGSKFAVAVSNGTVAIDLALKALEIGAGDEVIVTSRTFIASVSSIVNAGATPVFADVDRDSQNITLDSIRKVYTDNTKAIICVHLAGWPCDMDPIVNFAFDKDLFVIEDCAQAHGAFYKGRAVGSIGDIGCWSFCQDKIITTGGEGGMVTTSNKQLWNRIWSYKDHGKSWDSVYRQVHPPGFKWVHNSFGTNWRLTEMQSAIGRIQLRKLPDWSRTRRNYAYQILEAARSSKLFRVPEFSCSGCNADGACSCLHAFYKCYFFVNGNEELRDLIVAKINQLGVPCFSGSCSEVYLEKAFDNTDFRPSKRLPVARELGETSLMFLCHPSLSQLAIDKTCSVIKEVEQFI